MKILGGGGGGGGGNSFGGDIPGLPPPPPLYEPLLKISCKKYRFAAFPLCLRTTTACARLHTIKSFLPTVYPECSSGRLNVSTASSVVTQMRSSIHFNLGRETSHLIASCLPTTFTSSVKKMTPFPRSLVHPGTLRNPAFGQA